MDMRRFGSVLAFVTLLCALTVRSLEGKTRTELLSNEAFSGSASPEIDEFTAKWLWINCKVDLMDMKRTVGGHSQDMSIYSMANNLEKQSLLRRKLRKVLNVLPPHLKQTLLGCLRKHNIVFHVSGKAGGYNGWYTEFLEHLFRWPDASRRYLSDEFPGIAVASSLSSAPSPSPEISPPTYAPTPSADPPAPTPSADPPAPHFVAPSPRRLAEVPQSFFLSATPPDTESGGSGQRQSPRKKNSARTVVIAVVVTTGVTVFVAVLLFCCYRKCRKNSSSTDGPKDESPLLSISFNDFSGGSSLPLGKSTSNEKFGTVNGTPSSLVTNLESNMEKPSITGASLSGATLASNPSTDSAALPDNTSSVSPLPHPPGKNAPPPPRPPPPPVPSGIKPGPRPPPPPMGNAPPRPPPPFALKSKIPHPSPLGPNRSGSTTSASAESEAEPKTKLKPFFWDKVLANPDQSMVWHQIKSGSFQFNEETIETLFGYNNVDKNKAQRTKEALSQDPSTQYIQIIDSKKAQNLSILLRALNLTTEEVCDALYEGNELPLELCQTLLKMAPTSDEELKLRLYNGDLSHLGPAERFLRVLINIPFAFKRLDSLSFMISYHEEVTIVKESLATLEVACKELRSSRLFLKLLEAVLKTGNRMNNGTFRGGAQAFKLDTLLKLADVKGADGKTTLLHFVVQEIVRSEGIRAARAARENQSLSSVKSDDISEDSVNETEEHYSNLGLQVVSHLGIELENVKKASVLDADGLTGTVGKLGQALAKSREFLHTEMKSLEEDSSFHHTLQSFVQNAEVDITSLIDEEKRVMALVKNTADYFHGNAKMDEGLRLFVIVRNFLIMLDKTCKEVKESITRSTRMARHSAVPPSPDVSHHPFPAAESPEKAHSPDMHQLLFPAIKDRRMDHSSSDDEDS